MLYLNVIFISLSVKYLEEYKDLIKIYSFRHEIDHICL